MAWLVPRDAYCCVFLALTACSSNGKTEADAATDAPSTADGSPEAATDAPSGQDAPSEAASNPCEAGTCRFASDPSGPCEPPGGPITPLDSSALSGCCACGADGFCSAECTCASPDTLIATPTGDRAIATLAVGDLVLSVDRGALVAVPVREVHRSPVTHHHVVEVTLDDGAVLRVSAGHPTADGRTFGTLRAGDWLGGHEVSSARVVPYTYDATYDILPDSDTGTYLAGGALIGSTLARASVSRATPDACGMPGSAR